MTPVQLEVFDVADPATVSLSQTGLPVLMSAAGIAELRQSCFDEGYQAGLDAAAATHNDREEELRVAITHNLQELAFEYHDIRAHVLRNLRLLISEIVAHLLPQLAQAVLPQLVVEACMPLALAASDAPLRVHAHPDAFDMVSAALANCKILPAEMVADDSLAPAQVCVRLGAGETWVDPGSAQAGIAAALLACFSPAHEDDSHD